jgi:hypothetical protein
MLTVCQSPMANQPNIRRIVLCLLRFDLWAADTITDELSALHRLENIDYHFQRMWRGLPTVELQVLDEWLRSPELYYNQPLFALRQHVEGFSERQLNSVVMNSSARTFYTRLFSNGSPSSWSRKQSTGLRRDTRIEHLKRVRGFSSDSGRRREENILLPWLTDYTKPTCV